MTIPGEILAQEEVKSSSSDNTYLVTLFDNCISCTCPAGNKKEYCEHMQDLIYKNWQVLKDTNEYFYNKSFVLKDSLYGHNGKYGEYLLLADELIYIADEYTSEQAHISIMNALESHKQKLSEFIDTIESNYSKEQQQEILNYFWKAHKESHIPDSQLLFDLINKGFLKISERKHIEYRLEKYFSSNNIQKISAKKEFIFNQLPNLKGLPRGKTTSYDDTIDFISKNYIDLFDNLLIDFKTYSFGDMLNANGHVLTLYFYRTIGSGSSYVLNPVTNKYELKNDEITQIMQERGHKFEKPTAKTNFKININLNDMMKKYNFLYYKEVFKRIVSLIFQIIKK